jgi:FMN phosphatase YigB (HAD superfamily)
MIKALLLDLDNTLLENHMETFIPAYLSALGRHMAGRFEPEVFIDHLMRATDAMVSDTHPGRTNKEAFDAVFFPAIGHSPQELEPMFEDFYAHQFPSLRSVTRPNPAARPLITWAFAQGLQVVIATNPLFPLTAVEQRLEWGGVPVSEFPYDLVTSYETMHATKPRLAYYREIAQRLGRPPGECLMAGDEWDMDIRPAIEVGMQTFWIAEADQDVPAGEPSPTGRGSLADLARWLRGEGRSGCEPPS